MCVEMTRHAETQQYTEEKETRICRQVTNNTADGTTMEEPRQRQEAALWLRPPAEAFGFFHLHGGIMHACTNAQKN